MAPAPTTAPTGRSRWFALGAIALGVALVIMDATIANVALPVVIRDLQLSSAHAQWINAIYSLIFAAFIITAGRAGDVFGRRTVAGVGLSVFLLASLGAGSAIGPISLIIARLIQGLGAACVLPATLSTINAMFRGRDRAIAFAVYGSMIGGMAAVGPLVGGFLAYAISWRWAFWLNIPFGLIALIGLFRFTPNTRDPEAKPSWATFDIPGITLISLALGAMVFALIEASTFGWVHTEAGGISPILPLLAISIALIAIFLRVERTRLQAGESALVHLSLFRIPTFRIGAFTAFIVALGEFGLIFVLPLLLQGALGYTPLSTGWLMMALALGTFAASALVPKLVSALGKVSVVRIGLGAEAAALFALGFTIPAPTWLLTIILVAYGAGLGLASAQLTDTTMSDVPIAQSGMASGLQTTIRQLGSAMGIALLGGLMIARLTTLTKNAFAAAATPDAQVLAERVHDSVGAVIPTIAEQAPQAAELAAASLMHAASLTIIVAGAVLSSGMIAAFFLPNRKAPAPQLAGN